MMSGRQPTISQRKELSAALGYKVPMPALRHYCQVLAERGLALDDIMAIPNELEFLKLWLILHYGRKM